VADRRCCSVQTIAPTFRQATCETMTRGMDGRAICLKRVWTLSSWCALRCARSACLGVICWPRGNQSPDGALHNGISIFRTFFSGKVRAHAHARWRFSPQHQHHFPARAPLAFFFLKPRTHLRCCALRACGAEGIGRGARRVASLFPAARHFCTTRVSLRHGWTFITGYLSAVPAWRRRLPSR